MKKRIYIETALCLLAIGIMCFLTGCKHVHTIQEDVALSPTCTNTGLTAGSHCSECNEIIVAQEIIAALGHVIAEDKAVDPTCASTGLTAGSHCSVCNEVMTAQKVIPALEHVSEDVEGFAPTCTENGLTSGVFCSVCEEFITEQKEIPAFGHMLAEDKAIAETCTTTGLTAGSHCVVCGEVTEKQEMIFASGHKQVKIEAVAPTCVKSGMTGGSYCSVCKDVLAEPRMVPALGHAVIEDKAVAATFTQTGLTAGSHCALCNQVFVEQTITDVIPYWDVAFATASDNGYLVGETSQRVERGKKCVAVTAIANLGYRFAGWSDGSTSRTIEYLPDENSELTAYFERSYDIPTIYINTDGRVIDSKEEWINCSISTANTYDAYLQTDLSGRIKGRGNTTWDMPKRPYKFKLDSKTDLFGLGKAKNWVLLANYDDPSSLRTMMAFSLGKKIDDISQDTPDTIMVEVCLNGEYVGVYNLIEQIEIGNNRIDIDKDNTDDNTGYLLELDIRAPLEGIENQDYFVCGGLNYVVKGPKSDEELTASQLAYIKSYVTNAFAAVDRGTYEEITEWIDVETFAATYIIHEMMKSVDVGYTSFYLYKDKDGKLKSGPIWDFDISSGNCDYHENSTRTDYLWTKINNKWYARLLKFSEFRELVKEKLNLYNASLRSTIEEVKASAYANSDAYYRNFDRWKTIGVYVWPNPQTLVNIKSWEGNVDYLARWLYSSLQYMMDYYT